MEYLPASEFYRALGIPDPTPVEHWEFEALSERVDTLTLALNKTLEHLSRVDDRHANDADPNSLT